MFGGYPGIHMIDQSSVHHNAVINQNSLVFHQRTRQVCNPVFEQSHRKAANFIIHSTYCLHRLRYAVYI